MVAATVIGVFLFYIINAVLEALDEDKAKEGQPHIPTPTPQVRMPDPTPKPVATIGTAPQQIIVTSNEPKGVIR